ncbi:phosphotransferase [Nocardioides carbamazepini]|uniref:phosphotransferase n=1 Tax=Nocardioides carbamazepini TaxID=2854259 RepID=UPI002149B37B|nr:phosphotransferase [Nocardioides carbamazepini]MCR1785889.1 phosphotransferase [Nocardioides carbamazepini]
MVVTRRAPGAAPNVWSAKRTCLLSYLTFQEACADRATTKNFSIASEPEIRGWDRYVDLAHADEFDNRVLTWALADERDEVLHRYPSAHRRLVAAARRAVWTGKQVLVHADFHFDNCLVSTGGDRVVILDWDGAYRGCLGEGLDLVWADMVERGQDPAVALELVYNCRLRYGHESLEAFCAVLLRGASRRLIRLIDSMLARKRQPARIGAYVMAWYSRYHYVINMLGSHSMLLGEDLE